MIKQPVKKGGIGNMGNIGFNIKSDYITVETPRPAYTYIL